MNRRPLPIWLLALVVPLVALAALVVTRIAEGPSSAAAATAAASKHAVTIKNFAFAPARLTVAKGTMLSVTNADGTDHTISARDGDFDALLAPGATKTIRLDKPGTFAYSCKIHPSMHGTLVVK